MSTLNHTCCCICDVIHFRQVVECTIAKQRVCHKTFSHAQRFGRKKCSLAQFRITLFSMLIIYENLSHYVFSIFDTKIGIYTHCKKGRFVVGKI